MILIVEIDYCTQAYFLLHLGMPGRDDVEESSSSSGYSPSDYLDSSKGFQEETTVLSSQASQLAFEMVRRLILLLILIVPTRQVGLRDL